MQLLRIDWNVLFTIINLIVLYLLLKKFLIGPVTGIMQKRKEMIEGQLADADDKRKQAGELKQQYEDMLKGAHEESVKILEEARKNAQKEYDSKVKSADAQADKIIENAQKNNRTGARKDRAGSSVTDRGSRTRGSRKGDRRKEHGGKQPVIV